MPSDDRGSVSRLLILLKESDDPVVVDDVIRALWERYFQRLVQLAWARLKNSPYGRDDAEDVAHHALESFCIRAADGRFPQLDDRNDLWRILMTIASRKVAGVYRQPPPPKRAEHVLDQVVGREPSPELAAMMSDQLRSLLAALPNASYQTIAIKKMAGHTNKEIAEMIGCCEKNVENKLRHIRATWLPLIEGELAG